MNRFQRLYRAGVLVTGVLLASTSYVDQSATKKRTLSAKEVPQYECTPFDLDSVRVLKLNRRWKLVDKNMVVHDFGYRRKYAEATLQAIRQNRFSGICFIPKVFPPFIFFIPQTQVTKVVIVRHAEKSVNSNQVWVPLSPQGQKRAETLAEILDVSNINVVFATKQFPEQGGEPYVRTMKTVSDYADDKEIDIQFYQSAPEIVDIIREQYKGQSILVAGHTSTVPMILEGLGIASPPSIVDEFNNLFIVFLFNNNAASMMHLKYETHSN